MRQRLFCPLQHAGVLQSHSGVLVVFLYQRPGFKDSNSSLAESGVSTGNQVARFDCSVSQQLTGPKRA